MRQVSNGPVLRLDHVSKTYSGSRKSALDSVSFEVAAGEFFSILGPSGSGKTTVLRTIAGFERPDRGRVLMAGVDVTQVVPNKRDVRTVFQSYALFPHLTVAENVQYPLRMQGMSRSERALRSGVALEHVAMGSFATRLPHQLSGGQRQRVALARAIVSRPPLLLLDEPLGALDLRLRQQMQHTLVSLQKELRIAFVYVTHDQGEALSMSDRVVVMRDGRIAQLGTPLDLYYKPQSEFVAEFVGNSNMLTVDFEPDRESYVATIQGTRLPEMRSNVAGRGRVAIRYSDVKLAADDGRDGHAGELAGVVENVLFLGTNFEVDVRCGTLRIISSIPASHAPGFANGQTVKVAFDLTEARLFHG
jgi:spermidine/putrescine transport system ATP-binding protein